MKSVIGIRYEDKYVMERRVPIIPKHVKLLIENENIEVLLETSSKRVFTDEEFRAVGAKIVDNISDCPVIFGVKEAPVTYFKPGKTYIFFSHTIKGQSYNMPLLKKMMELGCNLIDYEKVEDEQGKRMIFFGKYAGLAGMINSLWSLGLRYKHFGIETPFSKIKQTHHYQSLEEAKKVISEVGKEISENGLPKELCPLTIGITGYGNVAFGVQEIAQLLPMIEISPSQLLTLHENKNLPNNLIYKTVFKEEHLSEPVNSEMEFELQHYYKNPHLYKNQFEKYIPHLSLLANCMYWDAKYPRIVTKEYLEKLYKKGKPKLTVIGDITCDSDGSIECTHKGTTIVDPIYVYNPFTGEAKSGFEGEGLMIMPVEILPAELPRDASTAFSNFLISFVPAIAKADYSKDFNDLELPNPIKKALILHKGELTKDFQYLKKYLYI